MNLDRNVCHRALLARDARFDGRFFVAVRSTGIYCRPLCGARAPKPENLTYYPTAAAAQAAGYRPCLRCRPESSPGVGAWLGTFSTVSRALVLIESGALDESDVGALAERLGVGERHLRRLFDQHIGASPIAVAQTRRLLPAKKLVHETSLSMTEIAISSGFGSLRRFNEIVARLRRLLDLDADPAVIASHLGEDPALKRLVSARPGLRLPGAWDVQPTPSRACARFRGSATGRRSTSPCAPCTEATPFRRATSACCARSRTAARVRVFMSSRRARKHGVRGAPTRPFISGQENPDDVPKPSRPR